MNAVRWSYSQVTDCLVAHPEGVLDALGYRDFRDTLIKFAVDQPRAVLVVVDRLDCAVTGALTAFSSAAMQVSNWPGVPILIVADRPEQRKLFDQANIPRFVPVFVSVGDALAAASRPLPRRRADLDLDRHEHSSRQARLFVQRTCQRWELAELVKYAEQIATELVENALLHTDSAIRLRLELRTCLLTVAVGDDSPREAVLRERVAGSEPGVGLRIVADRAAAWGCAPQLRGGKVVWATLWVDGAFIPGRLS